jgi:hypothetical protein
VFFDAFMDDTGEAQTLVKYRFRPFRDLVASGYGVASLDEQVDVKNANEDVDKTCFFMAAKSYSFECFIVKATLRFISNHFDLDKLRDLSDEVEEGVVMSGKKFDAVLRTHLQSRIFDLDENDLVAFQKMEMQHLSSNFNYADLGESEERYEREINQGACESSVPRVVAKYRRLLVDCLKTNKEDVILHSAMNAISVSMDELLHRNSTYKVLIREIQKRWHDVELMEDVNGDSLARNQRDILSFNENSPIERLGKLTDFAEYEVGHTNHVSDSCNKLNFGFNTMLSLSPLSRIDQNEVTGFNYFNINLFAGDILDI